MVCTNDELKHSYKRPGTRSKTSEMSKVTDSLDSVAAQPGQELYLFEGHTPRPVVAHRAQSTGRNGTAEGAPATRSKTSEMSKATDTLDSVAAQPGIEVVTSMAHPKLTDREAQLVAKHIPLNDFALRLAENVFHSIAS